MQIFELNSENNKIESLSLFKDLLALGRNKGQVQVYEINDQVSKVIFDKEVHRGIISDLHFSSSGKLVSIDICGDIAVYNSEFSISRVNRDGTYPSAQNKIASSPEGRFIAVLSNRNKHDLELYSSQLG